MFAKFLKEESGATAIEYVLLASLIGVALIPTFNALTALIDARFTTVGAAL